MTKRKLVVLLAGDFKKTMPIISIAFSNNINAIRESISQEATLISGNLTKNKLVHNNNSDNSLFYLEEF